jgi:rhodanese-related sulfurtransferase
MTTATTQTSAAESRIREVDAATVKQWLDRGEAVLIDVREPDEHARERIGEATLVPLSRFDPATIRAEPAKHIVLHCRSGQRSREAAQRLAHTTGSEVCCLAGGIDAWRRSGQPVIENRNAPIPIMRQVQITAGSLVFIGTLLGAFVNPWWLIVPGFVGAGLAFAGLTGTCGMATMLSKMPWNRIDTAAGP